MTAAVLDTRYLTTQWSQYLSDLDVCWRMYDCPDGRGRFEIHACWAGRIYSRKYKMK